MTWPAGTPVSLEVAPHPLLAGAAFTTTLPQPLRGLPSPAWLTAGLDPAADAPLQPDEQARKLSRDLLRHGGYKPTGRGKPASEYLLRAAGEGTLGSINAVVDCCNVVSLHSGLPITVVDLDRLRPPLGLALGEPGRRYVFNQAGQEIDVSGLLCLHDADGPCGNAVKDSQRTKTGPDTVRTLTVIWGAVGLRERTVRATAWYRDLLGRLGATTAPVLDPAPPPERAT